MQRRELDIRRGAAPRARHAAPQHLVLAPEEVGARITTVVALAATTALFLSPVPWASAMPSKIAGTHIALLRGINVGGNNMLR